MLEKQYMYITTNNDQRHSTKVLPVVKSQLLATVTFILITDRVQLAGLYSNCQEEETVVLAIKL